MNTKQLLLGEVTGVREHLSNDGEDRIEAIELTYTDSDHNQRRVLVEVNVDDGKPSLQLHCGQE